MEESFEIEEAINELLDEKIINSDIPTSAKKVLAALAFGSVTYEKAIESGIVIMSNAKLMELTSLNSASVQLGIMALQRRGLIEREKGERWTKGKQPQASKYRVNPSALKDFTVDRSIYININTNTNNHNDSNNHYDYNTNTNIDSNTNSNTHTESDSLIESDSYSNTNTSTETSEAKGTFDVLKYMR